MRPTIAPDVIVEHVSANANWNSKNAMNATPVSEVPWKVYVAGAPLRKKNSWPMMPLPTPNMKAKPNAQNSSAHRQVSTMHSCRMLIDLTRAGEAGLEHHEAGLHEEHEERGERGSRPC